MGTPYLKGYPPDEEFPKPLWLAEFVKVALQIAVGTFRCVLSHHVLARV